MKVILKRPPKILKRKKMKEMSIRLRISRTKIVLGLILTRIKRNLRRLYRKKKMY